MSERFHRDRPTIYAYLIMFSYVWGMYGMGPALLIIRDETGMSRTVASLHSTGSAVGFLIIGILGPRILARLGRSNTIRIGTGGVALGITLLAFGGTAWLSIPGALLIGLGGSMALNGANTFLAMHHGVHGPAAVGEGAGVSMLSGILSPLVLGAFVGWDIDWRLALMLALIGYLIADRVRGDGKALNVGFSTTGEVHGHLPALYWWAWIAIAMCIGVEFSFVMWAGDVLRDQSNASVSLAAASLTAVACGMSGSRFLIPPVLRRFHVETVFRASLLLPLIMWVPMWLSHNSIVILVCMVTIGAGLGLHYPLSLARMVTAASGQADLANARSSLASGIAISIAPLALGALADAVGLHSAFIAVPVMLVLAIYATFAHPVRV